MVMAFEIFGSKEQGPAKKDSSEKQEYVPKDLSRLETCPNADDQSVDAIMDGALKHVPDVSPRSYNFESSTSFDCFDSTSRAFVFGEKEYPFDAVARLLSLPHKILQNIVDTGSMQDLLMAAQAVKSGGMLRFSDVSGGHFDLTPGARDVAANDLAWDILETVVV